MLILKCCNCSSTFHADMDGTNICPKCGRELDSKPMDIIQSTLQHIEYSSEPKK